MATKSVEPYTISFRQSHHMGYSGYDAITRYMGNVIIANKLPRSVIRNRLMWWIANGVVSYDRQSLATELAALWRIVRSRRAIFHVLYGENTYHYIGMLNGFRGNKIVATFHQPTSVIGRVIKANWHIRQLSAAICVGTTQLDYFVGLLGEERVFFVPHGIDTDHFRPPENLGERASNYLLFVGNWLRDFPTLRGVVELLAYIRPSIRFVVVTKRENFERIGSHPNIDLLSDLTDSDLMNLYRKATALVLPLVDSTANNTLLEAMACGLPAVVSDVGSISDYATSMTCIRTASGNSQQMVSAILGLLDDPGKRRQLSLGARQRALDFAWPEIITKLQEVYRTIQSESLPPRASFQNIRRTRIDG